MQPLEITQFRQSLNDNYILVLTTNSHERKAVAECLKPFTKAKVPYENDGASLGICGEHLILHITGTSGGQADKAVGRIARRLLHNHNMPKPLAVILVGIAWGVPGKVKIGDVILAGKIIAVNHIRFNENKIHFNQIPRESSWANELATIETKFSSHRLAPTAGILASGELLFAAEKERDVLLTALPSIVGGEMEGWDLVPDLELPWLQIRGISDFANAALDRNMHASAAENAASLLSDLIVEMQERGRLPEIRHDPATIGLLEVLTGNSMHITKPDDDVRFDEHLNNRIGPSLIWRLAQYSLGVPPEAALPRILARLLLEISQNSIRHGSATSVTLQFGAKSVTYSDDGNKFDLFALIDEKRGRGGQRALKEVMTRLESNGYIQIEASPEHSENLNKYRISFPLLSTQIRHARENCSASIHAGNGLEASTTQSLVYNSDCVTVFFDASVLMMYTLHFDMLQSLQEIVDSGRNLIIKCAHETDKSFYESALFSPDPRKLLVIIVPN